MGEYIQRLNILQTTQKMEFTGSQRNNMFGEGRQDNYGGWSPVFADYKQTLELLKSPDEMVVYEAVMQLQNSLSIAQDNTMSNFAVDQYIPQLIEILKRPPITDFSNEINMFAAQCLTYLMDIFPNICNTIVTHGGVKCLAQMLESSMGFIDLNEACIKALEKISIENPHAILTSGAMSAVINMMDFFEITTQKRIISILMNISRQSSTEQDLIDFIMPLMPCIHGFICSRGTHVDTLYKVESISTIILRVVESVFRFLSPHNQLEKVSKNLENIGNAGIIEAIIASLQEYAANESAYCIPAAAKGQQASPSKKETSHQKLLANATVQNYLKALTHFSQYSVDLTQQMLSSCVFHTIEAFLPSAEDQKTIGFNVDQYPFIIETVSLIDALLPTNKGDLAESSEATLMQQALGKTSESIAAQSKLDLEKKQIYSVGGAFEQEIAFAAEKILPKIFNVHENNIQASIRNKTLSTIDKMILLFTEEMLNTFVEPYSFAKFIYSNLHQTNQLPSIQLCFQMVDKLMRSNPKAYTLPLVREGVVPSIKALSTLEGLEKATGVKFNMDALDPSNSVQKTVLPAASVQIGGAGEGDQLLDQLLAPHEMIEKARNAILKNSGCEDKALFEATIQKYMELSKKVIAPHSGADVAAIQQKQQVQQGKNILKLASQLLTENFENTEFLNKIYEASGEEVQMMNTLKQLAIDLTEESKRATFDFARNRDLMKCLAEALTKQKALMSYELKESGLLDALKNYLTKTPQQVELWQERQKLQGEEYKRSEEIHLAQLTKNANQLSKKQARSYIQRLKTFLHVMLNKTNGSQPIGQLINLCHDLISQSDYLRFESGQNSNPYEQIGGGFHVSDPNNSMNALRQLTKRMRINLVYDPLQSTMLSSPKLHPRDTAMSGVSMDEPLMAPPSHTPLQKAVSVQPAFMLLADQSALSAMETPSKVFIKRNFLYNELKTVMVSVEQCASLFLLEDFLRNRIKTMDEVKALKVPPSVYQSKPAYTSSHHRVLRHVIERIIDLMRDMMETSEGLTKAELRKEYTRFNEEIVRQITDVKELNEIDHIEIVRAIEMQSLQLMDEYFQDHQEDNIDQIITGAVEDQPMQTEERIFQFQRSIQQIREMLKNKPQTPKKSEEESTEKKGGAGAIMDMIMKERATEYQPKGGAGEDVEMTEEKDADDDEEMQEEERRLHRELRRISNNEDEDEDEEEDHRMVEQITHLNQGERHQQLNKEVMEDDLEQLIKANGDDIEYEFYVAGERMLPNQTIYEVLRNMENKAKKSKDPSGPMASSISQFLTQLHSDQLTIHFVIKDKQENLHKSRKDSILEFTAAALKRERTKSEALDDYSVTSVNSFVQQLIDKEFSVFSAQSPQAIFGGVLQQKIDIQSKEQQQLEGALKILKVLNYLCKNINLFSGQGIRFLMSKGSNAFDDEEMKEDGFADLDLQVGLSQVHANVFFHHKLDAYIMKNIQDPYNLISGAVGELLNQIFKNCSFLFPFHTRQLFFKLISFIGSIDMNRSIYFLRQFLKQKLGKLSSEDKNSVKIQKQKVIVDREKVLECSLNLMGKVSNRAFLEVEFKGEEGTGLGPTLEFFNLVSKEIKAYKTPTTGIQIWRAGMQDNTLYPSPINLVSINLDDDLQRIYDVFRLTGMMIAKSISDDRLIELPLSPVFWDLVLGKKMNIFDLERLDPNIFKVFADLQILANRKRDIDKAVFFDQDHKQRQINTLKTQSGARIEDLSLAFTLPGFDLIELKPNGEEEDVTLDNLQEYIDLVLHYLFHESVKIQIQAFKKGFNHIFPVDNLRSFAGNSCAELEDMICGTQRNEEEWSSVAKLNEFITPAHGFHQKSSQFLYFIRFMTELTRDDRRKFIRFITGSPRLPNGGFGSLDPKITVVLKKPIIPTGTSTLMSQEMMQQVNIDEILPSVMACQNFIKLPAYSTFEVLRDKFMLAINEGANSFTLS